MDPFDQVIGIKSKITLIVFCVLSMTSCGIIGQVRRNHEDTYDSKTHTSFIFELSRDAAHAPTLNNIKITNQFKVGAGELTPIGMR
jgi:hypothetical protein